jgi:hypothetical protein
MPVMWISASNMLCFGTKYIHKRSIEEPCFLLKVPEALLNRSKNIHFDLFTSFMMLGPGRFGWCKFCRHDLSIWTAENV